MEDLTEVARTRATTAGAAGVKGVWDDGDVVWIVLTLVAIALIAGIAGMATARIGYDPMSEPVSSAALVRLPEPVSSADVAEVRFDTAFRGYRMDQVDSVIGALAARIAELEVPRAVGETDPSTMELSLMADDAASASEDASDPAVEPAVVADPIP